MIRALPAVLVLLLVLLLPRDSDAAANRAQRLYSLQNEARIAHGLPPLWWDWRLYEVAQARANDMAWWGYFSHYPLGRLAFVDMLHARGIGYSLAAENIARNNYPEPAVVALQGFMRSGAHRDIVLDARLTHVGVGVAWRGGVAYFAVVYLRW